MKFLISVLMALSFTGCASMSQGSHQNITVSPANTTSTDQTQCTLKNEEGTWVALPNTSTRIDRDGNELTIDCSSASEAGKVVVSPEFLIGYLIMDIILVDACLISCIIDGANNAFYAYPDIISVPMARNTGITASTKK